MIFRAMKTEDYQELIAFWKAHYFVNEMDDEKLFVKFLAMNPGLSIVAVETGVIVGTVLGSYDGRRGYIQKLVVHTDHRGKGIAKRLITEVVEKLHTVGALYIPITVDESLVGMYETCGFTKTHQIALSVSWSSYNYCKVDKRK